MSEKKPRLFYWEEACDAWAPAPDRIENVIDLDMLDAGEEHEIRFKRFDMTDEELDALPEG